MSKDLVISTIYQRWLKSEGCPSTVKGIADDSGLTESEVKEALKTPSKVERLNVWDGENGMAYVYRPSMRHVSTMLRGRTP